MRSAVGDGVLAGSGRVHGRSSAPGRRTAATRAARSGARGGETIAAHDPRAPTALGVPVVGFPHSGGARLQEGAAALHAYAAIFRAQSLARVPQVSVVSGACAGGAAYSPALGDMTVMAGPGARMFLTGPAVVERRSRARDHRRGARRPARARPQRRRPPGRRRRRAGAPSSSARRSPTSRRMRAGRCRSAPRREPAPGDPAAVLPGRAARGLRRARRRRAARRRRRAARARAALGAQPRRRLRPAGGRARRRHRQPAAPPGRQPRRRRRREKGAWFVGPVRPLRRSRSSCSSTRPASCPALAQERAGVIRHGAVAPAGVRRPPPMPRVTVTLRQAYGGAHIVMNSRDLGADLTLAWPEARIGVMGARQAVEVVQRRTIAGGADADALAAAYAAEHLPVRGRRRGRLRRRGRRARRDARAPGLRAGGRAMTPAAAAARKAVQTRNATEEAILDAAREALRRARLRAADDGRHRAARLRLAHRRLLLLPQQARGRRPPHPARVQRDVRGRLAVPRRRRRAAPRALRRARARRRRRQPRRRDPAAGRRGCPGRERAPARRSGRRYIQRFVARRARTASRATSCGASRPPTSRRGSAPRRCWRWSRATSCAELVLRGGDASESIRVLAELWWRAVYSRPGDTAASVAAGS